MEQFQIGCLLKMITDKIKMRADADLAQQGLTLTQSRVLGYLDRSGGQATQKEIEGFLQVSHPTVAGIINRMEQNGFVRCRLDPADKRSKIVSQTERAAAVAQDMHATIQTTEQQMLRSLTPEQIGFKTGMLAAALFPLIGVAVVLIMRRRAKNHSTADIR